jgi:hypothetical protein
MIQYFQKAKTIKLVALKHTICWCTFAANFTKRCHPAWGTLVTSSSAGER